MRRHRDQAVWSWLGCDGFGEAVSQCRHDAELAVIFEARNQAVEQKAVGQRGVGIDKGRRVFEAGATGFAAKRKSVRLKNERMFNLLWGRV